MERAPLEPFKSPLRRWLALLMVLVGGELVLLFGGSALPLRRPVQAAVAVAVVAGVAAALWPLHLPRLQLTRLGRVAASVLCVLAATGYLYFTADRQGRSFLPRYTDEFSYLLQSKMLAAGRLWLPAHAHPEFFESFQIVVEPVYASIYFPGAALAYAVGVLIHAPQWLPPLVLSALCVELLRRIAGQWFGPAAGWLAALMLVGLSLFRLQSIMTMAQVPVLLAGLTMIWSWLRWRDSRGRGWFALLAVAAGWAAITRPVDALCFALPIVSAVAVELYRLGGTAAVRLGLLALACILPSLTIQLVFNRGITGAWFRTPFGFYAERFNPGTEYGFGRPAGLPQTQLPQKLAYYESFTRPFLQNHTPRAVWRAWKERRLRETLLNGLPHPVLLALLPVGMLSLGRSALAVAIAPLPLFALLYAPYAFWLPHYTLTTAPAVILLALAGIDALCRAAGRWHSTVWVFSWLSTAGVSIAELPEFNRVHRDEFFQVTQLPEIERALAGLSDQPAVVFFRWNPGCNPEEEPVYNIERPAIDDNRVVRAHDLGPRNLTLVTYYRATQPWRRFFLYDRISGTLSPYNPEFEGAGMTDTARIEQFRKMANDDPNNELAHFSLGKALLEAGLAGEAVGSFRRAIELNPNLSKAYQLLAAAQLQISDRSAAVATLTEGVKAADRRGDSLVKNEMIATLRELGAPVPELKAAGPVVTAGEGQVHCRRCGNVGPRLAKPPFRNAFGQEIFEGTCTSCWAEAIRMGTKVINELRLPLADPQAQRIWDQHIREFLNLG